MAGLSTAMLVPTRTVMLGNPYRRSSFRAAFAPAMRKGDAFIEDKLCIGAKIARHLSLSPKETTEVGSRLDAVLYAQRLVEALAGQMGRSTWYKF